jgi:hypothetical protein
MMSLKSYVLIIFSSGLRKCLKNCFTTFCFQKQAMPVETDKNWDIVPTNLAQQRVKNNTKNDLLVPRP